MAAFFKDGLLIQRFESDIQVVRVSLNALKNLLLASGLDVGPEMVDSGLQKVVTQRKQQASFNACHHGNQTGNHQSL